MRRGAGRSVREGEIDFLEHVVKVLVFLNDPLYAVAPVDLTQCFLLWYTVTV